MAQYKTGTQCVQAGWNPKNGEPRVLPIYQSTTFKYESTDQMARLFDLEEDGFYYSRLQNPTNEYVATKIAELEGGNSAMLTSSGQAALTGGRKKYVVRKDEFILLQRATMVPHLWEPAFSK